MDTLEEIEILLGNLSLEEELRYRYHDHYDSYNDYDYGDDYDDDYKYRKDYREYGHDSGEDEKYGSYEDECYFDEDESYIDEDDWDICFESAVNCADGNDAFRPFLYPRCFSGLGQSSNTCLAAFGGKDNGRAAKSQGQKALQHVESVKDLVLSEFDSFLLKQKNHLSESFPSQRGSYGKCWEIIGVSAVHPFNGSRMLEGLTSPNSLNTRSEDEDSSNFHNHLVVHRGKLGLLQRRKRSSLLLTYGAPIPQKYWRSDFGKGGGYCDRYGLSKEKILVDLGFIGEYLQEFSAAEYLLRNLMAGRSAESIASLLPVVIDPRSRQLADYQPPLPTSSSNQCALNRQQLRAVNSLKHNLEGIHGPPGTGKSTVIAHVIHNRLPPEAITLVTCVQNRAVNSIAEKLAQSNQPEPGSAAESTPTGGFIVYGRDDRIGESAKNWTLEAQVNRHPQIVKLQAAIGRYKDIYQVLYRGHKQKINIIRPPTDFSGGKPSVWHVWWSGYVRKCCHRKLLQALVYLQQRRMQLEAELCQQLADVKKAIIDNAKTVVCTIATATRSLLQSECMAPLVRQISTAIIDEAGTVSESKILPLIILPRMKRLLCVGDHHQLQPFTLIEAPRGGHAAFSQENLPPASYQGNNRYHARAEDGPVVKSFLERLFKTLPSGSMSMLTEQYRMHPTICEFISRHFYAARLQTAPRIMQHRLRSDPCGLYWLDYLHEDSSAKGKGQPKRITAERTLPGSKSLVNDRECAAVLDVLTKMLPPANYSVLVLSFYSEQVRLISQELKDRKRGFASADVKVHSVDQSQGMEADVVILSGVRSNPSGNIGFLTHRHRINVAISRARHRIVVVADPRTLCKSSKVWTSLHASCRQIHRASDLPALIDA